MDELAVKKFLRSLRGMTGAELRTEADRLKVVRDNWMGVPGGGVMALQADELYAAALRELGARRPPLVG